MSYAWLILYLIVPLAVLLLLLSAVVRFEHGWGGPFWWVHLPLNGALLAWVAYALLRGLRSSHNLSLDMAIPVLLPALVAFYAVVVPRVARPLPARFIPVARVIAGAHVVAFVLLFVPWARG